MDTNVLYYGDNLDILRDYIPPGSVDLVYLDPPFNSNQSYSAIFADESGRKSDAQIHAFNDSWHWGPTAEGHLAYLKNSALHQGRVPMGMSQFMAAMEFAIGKTPMLAYLVEMAVRLVELHRVLKPTGTLWLHCDDTASHYLKIVLDAIFGPTNFRNEVIWRRSNPKSHATINLPTITDTLLRYSKSDKATYHQPYEAHDQSYVDKAYRFADERGRYRLLPLLNPNQNRPNLTYEFLGVTRVWRWTRDRMEASYRDGLVVQTRPGAVPQYKKYLEDSLGRTVTNLWTDIEQVDGNERMGYPTQKPLALLERVISATSNPGDIVLDPFCGCGTATVAAQKLGRKWIGIDVTYLAIAVMRRRLQDSFPSLGTVPVIGQPTEVEGARQMALESPEGRYQFQWWALDMIGALPASGDQKKGSDLGIDGRITFTGADSSLQQAIVSVKSSKKPGADDIRVLKSVCEREGAAIGILVTLEEPTKPMLLEATVAGTYHSDVSDKDYPRIQIISVTDLLEKGIRPNLPPLVSSPYQRAAKIGTKQGTQQSLFGSVEG